MRLWIAIFALVPLAVGAQTDLSWNTIAGGGATYSNGGTYSLGGTIGQGSAGTLSGGSYSLTGGFWAEARTGPVTLKGHCTLGSFSGNPAGIPITIRIKKGASILETENTTLDASGNYQLAIYLTGTNDVGAKPFHWLSKKVANVPLFGSVTLDFDFAINGNASLNDCIDTYDLNLVFLNYGTDDPATDFNGSGQVNVVDMNMVFIGFTQCGEW
jgi:hypothetical protein